MFTVKLFGAIFIGLAEPPEATLTLCTCAPTVVDVVAGISTECWWEPSVEDVVEGISTVWL